MHGANRDPRQSEHSWPNHTYQVILQLLEWQGHHNSIVGNHGGLTLALGPNARIDLDKLLDNSNESNMARSEDDVHEA